MADVKKFVNKRVNDVKDKINKRIDKIRVSITCFVLGS